jgi:hypothetical protein
MLLLLLWWWWWWRHMVLPKAIVDKRFAGIMCAQAASHCLGQLKHRAMVA